MAILGLFLKSIFLVTLMIAIFIIGIIIYLYVRVKNVARSFGMGAQGSKGTKQASSANNRAKSTTTTGSTSSKTDFSNEELYDTRSAHDVNRKIFAKDEGEYVEFEEEK